MQEEQNPLQEYDSLTSTDVQLHAANLTEGKYTYLSLFKLRGNVFGRIPEQQLEEEIGEDEGSHAFL